MALIIFDMDGVLSDSLSSMIKSINKFSSQFGFAKISRQNIIEFKKIGASAYFSKYKISKSALISLSRSVKSELSKSKSFPKAFPSIKTLLRKLKTKHTLCILSSNSKKNIQKFIKTNNLSYFSSIHSSGFFSKSTMIYKIKKKYNQKPVYYVGDEDRDIEAAKIAKVISIAVSWGLADRKYLLSLKPDHLVDKADQIYTIINS